MKKQSKIAQCVQRLVGTIFSPESEIEDKDCDKQKNKQKKGEGENEKKERFEIFINLLEKDDVAFLELQKNGFVGKPCRKLKLNEEFLGTKNGLQEQFMNLPMESRGLVLQIVLDVLVAIVDKKNRNFGVLPPFNIIIEAELRKKRSPRQTVSKSEGPKDPDNNRPEETPHVK